MSSPGRRTGILLAAGRGRRFDASGVENKLLQTLDNGQTVASQSALNLLSAMPHTVAVLRPGSDILCARLQALGVECVFCDDADAGMAHSLQAALRASAGSAGWLIALADMPFVQPDTMQKLLQALQNGKDMVAPVHAGRRGNPVGFSQKYLPQLLALQGDTGARQLLQTPDLHQIGVADAGIHQDIDLPQDLLTPRR
ncbi:nucleotidyltransferase family protein [Undibacterium sp. CY18W]|uniref:Nucleotidyltransferase family protein n=1 Tax=Undibacterium hunanense TaxID=2762292 RepID=A0ABR6ZZ69_9BURK|nr:nucleotidyltransferase family protein [Undibacterium hunanense]MBC3920948.1 nucleotidyltransferase family protein [Undibacterium hunanense]